MKKRSTPKARGITLKDVIAHIQGFRNEMNERMDRIEIRLDQIEADVKVLKDDVRVLKSQMAYVRLSIENIDHRLDDVEIKRLPKLEKKVLTGAGRK